MRHCLNILRQGILCASDSTLAFSKPTGRTEEGLFTAKFNNIGTERVRSEGCGREDGIRDRVYRLDRTVSA